jgi:hypothetical protein
VSTITRPEPVPFTPQSDRTAHGEKKLGRIAPKSSPKALMFARFAAAPAKAPPKATNFWKNRKPFPIRTFGNERFSDCTRAKQAIASMRMERLETTHTPEITDEEVVRVYMQMEKELYDGTDSGAYETDALDQWRRPEKTFKDVKGRPLTIDAYLRINHTDQPELRRSLWTAESHGIAVCLALPNAFKSINPPAVWDIPEGTPAIGNYKPGSWGGHSMWARDYDETGLWLVHTWGQKDQLITWRAAAIYLDEAHLVIDSLDYWRKHKPRAARAIDLAGVKKAVNAVSSQKIV